MERCKRCLSEHEMPDQPADAMNKNISLDMEEVKE